MLTTKTSIDEIVEIKKGSDAIICEDMSLNWKSIEKCHKFTFEKQLVEYVCNLKKGNEIRLSTTLFFKRVIFSPNKMTKNSLEKMYRRLESELNMQKNISYCFIKLNLENFDKFKSDEYNTPIFKDFKDKKKGLKKVDKIFAGVLISWKHHIEVK